MRLALALQRRREGRGPYADPWTLIEKKYGPDVLAPTDFSYLRETREQLPGGHTLGVPYEFNLLTNPHENPDENHYWNGEQIYGVKWRNFKLVMVEQKYLTDPTLPLGFPHIVNLMTDPKEREPFNPVHLHSWPTAHFGRLLAEFKQSVAEEPLIPAGAPLDFVPQPR
jgi:hypothetical protein